MNKKIGFNDIFDTKDIEKVFEQTLEFDILKLMDKWHNENKQTEREKYQKQREEQEQLKNFIKQTIKEEMQKMLRGKGLFGEKIYRELEVAGFERNCIGCMFAEKNYGSYSTRGVM